MRKKTQKKRRVPVSKRLKMARIECGLSQQELADMVGVSQSLISDIERGHKTFSYPLGVKLVRALKIDHDYLAGEDQ